MSTGVYPIHRASESGQGNMHLTRLRYRPGHNKEDRQLAVLSVFRNVLQLGATFR